MEPFSWNCPFCNHAAIIRGSDRTVTIAPLRIDNARGEHLVYVRFIVCPNRKCKQFVLDVGLEKAHYNPTNGEMISDESIHHWRMIPDSDAKVFPDFVPAPILEDYQEACAIRERSPKSAATLARRCLQGMIRDFWNVRPGRLLDEIDKIKDEVHTKTWEAMDAVRHVGNIGAHMEKDINLIVEVDPGEAGLLIGLIETLIEDWYIARYDREKRLKAIIEMSNQKKAQQKPPEADGSSIDDSQ